MLYPGAFNMTTGPLHWELLLRSRAVDSQTYVAGVAPAQDKNASYISYGHTLIADPWGKVIDEAEFEEDIIYAEIGKQVHSLVCWWFYYKIKSPRGKESTEVWITQKIGKERGKSYLKNEEISG